jgi:hypothetical protein
VTSEPSVDMLSFPKLPVGTRVRVRAPSAGLVLKGDLGRIMGPDDYDGYYVVRLDAPALYDHGGEHPEELTEIVELIDNLDVLPPVSRATKPHR